MLDQQSARQNGASEDEMSDIDRPTDDCPPAPPWHVESDACRHGWIQYDAAGPKWLLCDCESPADPWPPRAPTDGPRDCECAICYGKPRRDRGRIDGCEHRDHHCENCHEQRLCTASECGQT